MDMLNSKVNVNSKQPKIYSTVLVEYEMLFSVDSSVGLPQNMSNLSILWVD